MDKIFIGTYFGLDNLMHRTLLAYLSIYANWLYTRNQRENPRFTYFTVVRFCKHYVAKIANTGRTCIYRADTNDVRAHVTYVVGQNSLWTNKDSHRLKSLTVWSPCEADYRQYHFSLV